MFNRSSDLHSDAIALVTGEKNLVANLANLASHIFHSISGLNWVGFYLWNQNDHELVLGPFQGKPACIRIQANKGVCELRVYNSTMCNARLVFRKECGLAFRLLYDQR